MALLDVDTNAKVKFRKCYQKWQVLLPITATVFATCLGSVVSAQSWIPSSCCPNTDCQQATTMSVSEVQGGYTVEGIKGVVSYDDPRIQPSFDGQYHTCIRSKARPNMSQTTTLILDQKKELKCLFVPLLG